MDVLPADLVREAVLIVRRRIENVKRAVGTVARRLVTGSIVVFPAELGNPRARAVFVVGPPVRSPRAVRIGTKRTQLSRALAYQIQPLVHLADHPEADGL